MAFKDFYEHPYDYAIPEIGDPALAWHCCADIRLPSVHPCLLREHAAEGRIPEEAIGTERTEGVGKTGADPNPEPFNLAARQRVAKFLRRTNRRMQVSFEEQHVLDIVAEAFEHYGLDEPEVAPE